MTTMTSLIDSAAGVERGRRLGETEKGRGLGRDGKGQSLPFSLPPLSLFAPDTQAREVNARRLPLIYGCKLQIFALLRTEMKYFHPYRSRLGFFPLLSSYLI